MFKSIFFMNDDDNGKTEVMIERVVTGAITGFFLLGMTVTAQANLVVYTDKDSFLANAGITTVYDFESDVPGYIGPPSFSGGHPGFVQDFGDFSIDATGNGIYLAEVRRQNGNNDIYLNSYTNNASLDVLFDNAVTAFGFTYVAEGNQSWDHSTFSLNAQTWDLGIPGDSGFFGVVDTTGTFAAGTAFSFGQQSSNWSGLSFDNIIYSSNNPASIPEPATVLLFGTGLVGLVGLRKRTEG